MKKIPLMLLFMLLVTACSTTPKIEKNAQEQCTKLFTELAKDPSSVKLSDFRTVYRTDSLCILHLVFTAKNGLGVETSDDMEYIYFIGENNNVYESYVDLSENDSIFMNEQALNAIKPYTFYKNLNYSNALKQRVIAQLNESGRVVGNPSAIVDLEPLVKTGKWTLKYYKDEFGEYGDEKYLVLRGNGVFSNSATTNSEMSAILFVDKDGVSMRLIEYKSSVVKDDDSFDLKIKDANGEVTNYSLYNSKSGYIYFTNSSYFGNNADKIRKLLDQEGIIRCSGKMYDSYSSSSYTFTFDLSGYKAALTFL